MKKTNILLIVLVSALGLIFRLIPHVPNFSPFLAIVMFSAVYTSHKKSLIIPFVALFISDLFLGFYHWPVMIAVYGSYALMAVLGIWLKKHKSALNITTGALASGLLFFVITNLAVWASSDWYEHSLSGLAYCFTLAVPFFRMTILSNIIYTALLFGAYETIIYFVYNKKNAIISS